MEEILRDGKKYELITIRRDPLYDEVVRAIDIVRLFIREHSLLVYGGSAIDYALRLKGSGIYPDDMLAVPDLDVYSPTNVQHSYDLADILYREGFSLVRAINAQHTETMRVDIGENHFIADISFLPAELFEKIPFLICDGMRVVHPDYQRIDMHIALSLPYENAPREVIFSRWSRDIARFNLLSEHYPLQGSSSVNKYSTVEGKIPREYVAAGFYAYFLYWSDFTSRIGSHPDVHQPNSSYDLDSGKITVESNRGIEILHQNPSALYSELAEVKKYEAYAGIGTKKITGVYRGTPITVYSGKNKLFSVSRLNLFGKSFRAISVQGLLRHFMSDHFYYRVRGTPEESSVAHTYYLGLCKMIQILEERNLLQASPFCIDVKVYGSENINEASKIAIERLQAVLKGTKGPSVPRNYYPGRGKERPVFNPDEVKCYCELGREKKIERPEEV